jgi:RNA recognition motif. (a.k.a. RRM, RBD, or RNP domain)
MSNQPPSSSSAHSSLPARPNGPLPSFKPAFNPSTSSWQKTYSPTVSAGPAPPSNFSAQPVPYPNNQGAYDQGQYYQQPSLNYYQQSQSQSTPPNLQNPFPAPGTATGPTPPTDYDPELQAQIAQWQSTYAAKDDKPNANYTPLGVARGPIDVGNAVAPGSGVAAVVSGTDGKQKTVIRSGGGKSWQDASLLEWDPTHPRLFIGNLAGEVTDDSLLKAFSRYPSISKARVVRDKRTSKSKGFGFVSFASSDDYFQAAKEMQGKYIGSHPVLIKRSTTEIKASAPQAKGKHDKGSSGHHNRNGGGVQKKLPKKKGGLKLLG